MDAAVGPVAVLSRESPVPLYRQLTAVMAHQIDRGELRPGTVTSEQGLASKFGVSRITSRQALTQLQREGRVFRVPGKGTFVAERRKLEPQSRLTSFSENMTALGKVPTYRTLSVGPTAASPQVADALALEPADSVLSIFRLLLADGVPMAVMRAHVPPRISQGADGVFTRDRLDRFSFYWLLERELGVELWKARETVEAVCADTDAHLLALEADDLLLVVHRQTLDRAGRAVEYTELKYRADLYRYRVELFRHPPD